ncbi:MAG: hypothetical protein ACK5UE_14865 [Chitinophagales bacterium]|jgi:hypothetical protein|nr:hypothetical protein [Sphingobacteriales bacterium]
MKLLLDKNLPKILKLDFQNHKIYTIQEKNWQGIKNGELLMKMLLEDFYALLTFDKNLQHQQNFNKYTLTVFVYQASIAIYEVLSPKILSILEQGNLNPEPIVIQ